MVDPADVHAIDDIKFMTGYDVIPLVASEVAVMDALTQHYGATGDDLTTVLKGIEELETDVATIEETEEDIASATEAEEAPVIKLANVILSEAVRKKVSDIHIEPYEHVFRVRYRLDGSLYEVMSPPKKLQAALTSRFKIMSSLDIAEPSSFVFLNLECLNELFFSNQL